MGTTNRIDRIGAAGAIDGEREIDAPPMGVLATFTYSSTTSPRDIGEWQKDYSVLCYEAEKTHCMAFIALSLASLFCMALPGSFLVREFCKDFISAQLCMTGLIC